MNIWHFKKHSAERIIDLNFLSPQGFIWIDGSRQETQDIIRKAERLTAEKIDERHIQDCLNLQHPCFYDSGSGYDILIFRNLISENYKKCTETKPVAFLLLNGLLVSFNSDDPAIQRVIKKFETTRKLMPSTPMQLLFFILDEMVDNFLALRAPLLEQFNYWQNALFLHSQPSFDWINFLNFKTEIRTLRTLSEDQQEVIYQWRQDNEMGLTDQLTISFNDLSNHIDRIITHTTQLESDLDTLIELYYLLIGNRTNDIMRVLTVLSAIFLPLNLVAGIFGMNFANMHLINLQNGADIALIGMIVLGIVLFIIFKWKKWI